MTEVTRRQLLQRPPGAVAPPGAVVLARAALAEGAEAPAATPADPDERAGRLAGELPGLPGGTEYVSLLHRGSRNGGGGAFRNSAFRNAGAGGGFRNGGFR